MADLRLEKGNKGAALFLRRQQAAEQSAIVKEAEESKSDAVNTTRSTFQDPINSNKGIVRKSSFRSSQKQKMPPPPKPTVEPLNKETVEKVEPAPVVEPPASTPITSESKVEETVDLLPPKMEETIDLLPPKPETGSSQIKRNVPDESQTPDVDNNNKEIEALGTMSSTLDQVASKLSSLKSRQNDDDVFAQGMLDISLFFSQRDAIQT